MDTEEGGPEPLIRVLGPNGEDWGLMTMIEAVDRSVSLDLDLFEIDGSIDPPIWRISDYGRMKYEDAHRNEG